MKKNRTKRDDYCPFEEMKFEKRTISFLKVSRPRVRDTIIEINDMFVSYLFSPKPLKL